MRPAIRKVIAALAASGLGVSLFAYVGSCLGLTMDGMWRLAMALHVGIFVLFIVTQRNYVALKRGRLALKGLLKGSPRWVVSAFWLLTISFAVHFLLFAAESHGAAPDIKNGRYVLDNRIITQHEYLHLEGAELRLFATFWMCLYFVLTAYWWFPQTGEELIENEASAIGTHHLPR